MNILVFIVIGLVAGLIARAVVPGKQAMGIVATALLGMAGSLLGGFVGSLLTRGGQPFELRPAGIIFSIICAAALLFLIGAVQRRRVHA